MLSPEAKKKAEDHLVQIDKEITDLSVADYAEGSWGADYIKQLRTHRDLWMKFLGKS